MLPSEKPVNRHARFGLRGPNDLLRKMAHDWKRMRRYCADGRPECSFAALDFAISAWSMVDWVKEYLPRKDLERMISFEEKSGDFSKKYYEFMLSRIYGLRLCKEIANGSKHFFVSKNPDVTIITKSSPIMRFRTSSEDILNLIGTKYYLKVKTENSTFYADDLFRKTWISWWKFLKKEGIDQRPGQEVHLHTPELP